MIRIGIDELMSLRLKTVSARSMVFPVDTSTAMLKVACCALMIAASPLFTVTISPPVVRKHFSTCADGVEQTSIILLIFLASYRLIDDDSCSPHRSQSLHLQSTSNWNIKAAGV